MNHYIITDHLENYRMHLMEEERCCGTIEKYLRDIRSFLRFLGAKEVTKERVTAWKEYLSEQGYAPVTINSMLSAVNGFFGYMGWHEYRVKFLRVQRKIFREPGRELNREEYGKLLAAARTKGQERLALVMETICATGIRVSEVKYITVETARAGRAEISLKGKIRTILLPGKLCKKLLKYAGKNRIREGSVFITRSGGQLSRCQIWQEMKRLCAQAGVTSTKVFPHNLRHLFATVFYRACKDIVQLADILGHCSIETTRIYLISSGREHARRLDRLGLVI